MKNSIFFDHEKLHVYQESLNFIKWVEENTKDIPKSISAKKHLDEASTSVLLNIAEGNGNYTPKDKCRFFDISRGSALECAACLDILKLKNLLQSADEGKYILKNIVSQLVGLIKSKSKHRIYDESLEYDREQ